MQYINLNASLAEGQGLRSKVMDAPGFSYWPPDPAGLSPWAWFLSLSLPSKICTGALLFGCVVIYLFLPLLYDDEPSEGNAWIWRISIGPVLALSLTWYYWQAIYHYVRWWLPFQGYFLQMGNLVLVFIGLVLFGFSIECGLFRGGYGAKNTMGSAGLQRGFGCFATIAFGMAILSFLYGLAYPLYWLVTTLDNWRRA